jgi:hypothetical protein
MPPKFVPHWSLHCKHCGAPMWLLAEKIRPLFAHPGALANEFHVIAVAHDHCKRVETYTLHRDFPDHNPRDGVILVEPHYGDVVPLGSLQCEAENCSILLPLFAVWSRATTDEQRVSDTNTWNWESLRCPKGHVVRPVSFEN